MKNILLSLFCLSLLLNGCSTKLETVKPTESYIPETIKPNWSTINANIHIDVAKLEKSINANFKGVLYEDNSYADDNMQIKISKIKDFNFSITGNKINCTLPLKVWVKYELKKNVLGVTIKDYYEAEGSIQVALQTAFSIDKNWNLKTVTSIQSYKWVASPTVTVAGVTIPVTTIANIALNFIVKDMGSLIDTSIADNFQLRPMMESMWKSMYSPIEIDKDYQMWLRMMPLALYSSPIVGSGKSLSFSLGIKTTIETTMGEELQELPLKAQAKLPEYSVSNDIKPDFTIESKVLLTYSKVSELAQKYVVGQEFSSGRKKIIIDSVSVFGQENSLIVAVGIKGSVNGMIYCSGNLQFIDSIKTIKISNFDFDVATKNTLVKSADWLLHKSFLKKIEPMLTISVKQELEDIVNEGNEYLKNYSLYKGVTLQAKLSKVQVNDVYLHQKGIVIHGAILGKLTISITDF